MKNKSLKLALLSGLTFLSLNANAMHHGFNGAYAGVAGGYLVDKSLNSAYVSSDQVINDNTAAKTPTGLSAGIYGGYGYVFPYAVYAGVEGKFTYFNNYTVQHSDIVATRLEYKHFYHLSLRLGKVFEDRFLVYGKAGYVNGRTDFDSPAFRDQVNPFKKTKNIGGYELGVGFASKVSDCLDLGLEISQSYFEKYKFTQPEGTGNPIYRTIKPRLMNVELRLSYQF